MTQELNLTEAQQTQIRTIHESARTQFKAVHDNASLTPEQKRARMQELRTSVDSQINAVLTAEQRQKWAAMKADREKRQPRRNEDSTR